MSLLIHCLNSKRPLSSIFWITQKALRTSNLNSGLPDSISWEQRRNTLMALSVPCRDPETRRA